MVQCHVAPKSVQPHTLHSNSSKHDHSWNFNMHLDNERTYSTYTHFVGENVEIHQVLNFHKHFISLIFGINFTCVHNLSWDVHGFIGDIWKKTTHISVLF
jgi:hypothetical protein